MERCFRGGAEQCGCGGIHQIDRMFLMEYFHIRVLIGHTTGDGDIPCLELLQFRIGEEDLCSLLHQRRVALGERPCDHW